MNYQMNYLCSLTTFLPHQALVVGVLSTVVRAATINYITTLPMTVTTTCAVVIHLHPQIPHHLLKGPLHCYQPILLHQLTEHQLTLHM